jgi:septal ring factor EnvC (AmiA/AmiB activator)
MRPLAHALAFALGLAWRFVSDGSRKGWLACALAFALGVAGPAFAQEDELGRLRRAIAERRERVASFEREELGLFAAIEAADAAAREIGRALSHAERDADGAERDANAREAELADVKARLARTRELIARRAVALYKAGELGPVAVVFSAGSLADRIARIQALQLLLDHDQKLLARSTDERNQLARARIAAQQAGVYRNETQAALLARRAELAEERRARRALLEDVRRDRARERALLNELEAAARELSAKLEGLAQTPGGLRPGATPFATLAGRLAPPVPGRVLRGYGRVLDTEYRTETFRKGVDFSVESGEPVYAVAAGEVRFAGWFAGYGRMVILDHGDSYFSVSGHLDEIAVAVGDALAAGDRIGDAGETGSLTGPRLYFEIRHAAEALDPADWLHLAPEL